MSILIDSDKKVLQQAQRSWLAFRDSEFKLVELISTDQYSGEGTMYQLSESGAYLDLMKSRVIALFEHYKRASRNQ